MSNQPGPPVDEAPIAATLRALLEPLDRHLGAVAVTGGLSIIFGCPALFVLLWAVWLPFYLALPLAFAAFVALLFGGRCLEKALASNTLDSFNTFFPPGSPQRPVALRLLGEMESPNRAEAKLRELLQRGQTGATPEQQVDNALAQLNTASPAPAPTPAPPAPASPGGQRPGGYYDYIPLELPPGTEEKKG